MSTAMPSDHHPSSTRDDAQEALSIVEPEDLLPALELGDLPDTLKDACAHIGWTSLMPVQSRALPYLLAGRDIMVQSRTGSGKTGAYLLPLLSKLDAQAKAVQALALVPTRELALQVEREAQILFGDCGLSVASVYGGVGYGKQIEALKRGVSVVIGTPGRVLDHLLRRTLLLDNLRSLVFDEADRMLSIGFYPDMKEVQKYLPKRPLQVSMFSATFPPYVIKLAKEFMRDPQMLSLSHKQVHVTQVQHIYYECNRMEKEKTLLRALDVENPASAIIFCNTKADVHYINAVLQGYGLNSEELSADLSQSRREEVMAALRSGKIRFLAATDVAARGIDIPELSHVILYDPPEDRESYIHRAGRTGRAGAAGVVISLVDIMQKLELERIAKFYKINMILQPAPTEEEVVKVVSARLIAQLEAKYRKYPNALKNRVERFTGLAKELGSDAEQSYLMAMLLDDAYQAAMHDIPTPQSASGKNTPAENKTHGAKKPRRRKRSGSGTGNQN
jgi:ATP-dependent RNA helicase DeaD